MNQPNLEIFDSQASFASFGLTQGVLQGITDAGFTHPTHIQAKLIPAIMSGQDVIGQAKTGTGKTASFALPILQLCDPTVPFQALILVPTRELASQVAGEINDLGKNTTLRAVCIIGGESIREQTRSIKKAAHILVGTPGRVMDMKDRGEIHFSNIRFIVLDEVDRMLDIGFRDDIRKILSKVSHPHQTIFVSATLDPAIESLARQFMKPDACKLVAVSGALTVSLVDQKYLPVEHWDKKHLLLHLLTHEEPQTTVVFCKTKMTVHRIATYLKDKGINCREIHGDLPQNKRNRVMESLRAGNLDVLIASDLAARGLDVEHISHVINYDLPEDPEIYVHRIGRTARAGKRGIAWSFVCPDQGQLLTDIEKLTGVIIEKLEYPDFTPGPVPTEIREQRDKQTARRSTDPIQSIAQRSAPASLSEQSELSPEEIARRFPSGIIPKSAPPSSLGRRFRSRR